MKKGNFFYIETYGCSANKNNSEILAGILTQSGFQTTTNPKIADIIIINSCVVKGKTKDKIKRKIQELYKYYSDKLIIIAGCMPQIEFKKLQKLNPRAIFLGTHHFKDIVKLINEYQNDHLTDKKQFQYLSKQDEEKILLPKIPSNKLISITQISEGCLGDCSYCNVRLAKGLLFSYPEYKILNSIENDLKNSAKEVWLTSQDCSAYGIDRGENSFPELLKKILELKYNFKLRLGMSNPNHLYSILDKLIKIYRSPKLYKFFHIPIQSASNNLLKDMKRHYKIEQAEEIIKKFKKEFPDMTISTDIIVGYPTETENDHKKNLEFIKKYKPDVLNLSKFSKHKETEAEKLIEMPRKIISRRTIELMNLHRKTAYENKKKFLKKTIKVFVNEKKQSFFEARDENYNIILIKTKDNILGKNINVKINKIGVHHMIGEV